MRTISSQIGQSSPIAAEKSAVIHSPVNAIVIICAIFRVQFVARDLLSLFQGHYRSGASNDREEGLRFDHFNVSVDKDKLCQKGK
jgi:hypothetical protein